MCEHDSAGVVGSALECIVGDEKYLVVRTDREWKLSLVYRKCILAYCFIAKRKWLLASPLKRDVYMVSSSVKPTQTSQTSPAWHFSQSVFNWQNNIWIDNF